MQLIPELFTLMTLVSQDDVQNNLAYCTLYPLFSRIERIQNEYLHQVQKMLVFPMIMTLDLRDDTQDNQICSALNLHFRLFKRRRLNAQRSQIISDLKLVLFLAMILVKDNNPSYLIRASQLKHIFTPICYISIAEDNNIHLGSLQ